MLLSRLAWANMRLGIETQTRHAVRAKGGKRKVKCEGRRARGVHVGVVTYTQNFGWATEIACSTEKGEIKGETAPSC